MFENDGELGQGDGIGGGTFDGAEAVRCALALAKNCGWAVFPCKESKAPATPHGFKDASKDADSIAELWRRYPGPLIGVATGEASGIAVLDLDVKHDAARAWWHQNRHRIPPTRRYRTKSGGMHCYFQHRPGIGSTAGKIAPGVDTRGNAGYVVHWFAAGLPCLDDSPPTPWPDWLYDLLHPPAPPPRPAPPHRRDAGDQHHEPLIRAVREAGEGRRNGVLFWSASRMREGGAPLAEALAELLPAAIDAGLSRGEARATIASAWRHA